MKFPSNWNNYESVEWALMVVVAAFVIFVIGAVLFALVWGPDGVPAVIRAWRGV